jgi:hypothetical protein
MIKTQIAFVNLKSLNSSKKSIRLPPLNFSTPKTDRNPKTRNYLPLTIEERMNNEW